MKQVAKRRRREGKTNYSKRIMLLKSERPRMVFRKTNKYIISQYVESHDAQDKVIFGVDSRELLKHGWSEEAKGSLKSVTASYLTGYLVGKKIKNQNLKEPIVDFGMFKIIYKGRLFAFLKGLIDAGLNIDCKEKALPEDERVKGQHLKNKVDFDKIKSSIDKVKNNE